jgi:hypothetical protein
MVIVASLREKVHLIGPVAVRKVSTLRYCLSARETYPIGKYRCSVVSDNLYPIRDR